MTPALGQGQQTMMTALLVLCARQPYPTTTTLFLAMMRMMTGDVGAGSCSHYPWLRSLMGWRGHASFPGSLIGLFTVLPAHETKRVRTCEALFTILTRPSRLYSGLQQVLVLATLSALLCLLACSLPMVLCKRRLWLTFTFTSPNPPPPTPTCGLFTAHIAKSVCGRAPSSG